MARRRAKLENKLWGSLLIVVLIGWLIATALNSVGTGNAVALVIICVGGIALWKVVQRQRRLEYLREKYGDEEIVQRIMRHRFWQGQTAEQLRDSVGNPVRVDNKVMATRTREVWKYNPTGQNRYGLRVTLDDGIVIGWDQKN
jgi:hypothetical protein